MSPEQQRTHAERPMMNSVQEVAIRDLCARYGVRFFHSDYVVHPENSWMMPGWAEGWVGGVEYSPNGNAPRTTIYMGCDPFGRISS